MYLIRNNENENKAGKNTEKTAGLGLLINWEKKGEYRLVYNERGTEEIGIVRLGLVH